MEIQSPAKSVKDGGKTILNHSFVETIGRIDAKVVAAINAQGFGSLVKKKDVPGSSTSTFGAYLTWNKVSTHVDLKNLTKLESNGWQLK